MYEIIGGVNENQIEYANFDAEIGAYGTFSQVFAGVKVKICSFHAKQGLYRKVF